MAKKILLADDSITIQKVVELTFSDGDYEVTAVNNGAKAIAKLAEMRPDIILSDIIMPEKNGYEVCEYVKSHPEFRNLPVVLLTGTFEPFDPDRADKAGCDAVVTKPFESQSLIHKVEELIASSRANAAAAAPAPAPEPEPAPAAAPSPWMDDEPATPADSPFAAAPGFSSATGGGFATNSNDIFSAAPAAPPTTEMPFMAPPSADLFNDDPPAFSGGGQSFSDSPAFDDTPAFGGETRAFPKMSFDEMARMANAPAPASPWDEQPPAFDSGSSNASTAGNDAFGGNDETAFPPADAPYSGETRAFPKMSFDDLQQQAPQPAFGDDDAFGGSETPAFPPVSFDDMSREANQPETAASTSPWDDQPAASEAAFGGETRAFPKMSFDDMQRMAGGSSAPEPSAPADEPSPWGDSPAASDTPAFPVEDISYAGETRAFPKMSFEEMQQMGSASAPVSTTPEPSPWDTPDEPSVTSTWSPTSDAATYEPAPSATFGSTSAPFGSSDDEATPFASSEPATPAAEEPAWASTETTPQFETAAVNDAPPVLEALPVVAAEAETPAAAASSEAHAHGTSRTMGALIAGAAGAVAGAAAATVMGSATPISNNELTDEQIDRIARRVVQLMSEQVVRNIAWEVIPDLAEMVVKERIRQLESEA